KRKTTGQDSKVRGSKTTSANITPKRGRKAKKELDLVPEEITRGEGNTPRRSFINRRFLIFLLLIGLLALAYYKRGIFIAATVNNQPITNLQLIQKMNQSY